MVEDPLLSRAIAAVGDDYEIEAEVGRGGMAVVYRARDKRLRRLVAIKVLPPELAFRPEIRSRFLREAETAARLSHPHIVPIFSFGERQGVVFFVMGLVQGCSLAEELHRDPRPPIDLVRRVLAETADALDYAHRNGVVHRDIKPDNILLDRETGRTMVTDFGIARAVQASERLTQTGIAVGTPTYMSPEQALGEREVDGRADVYSLGAVGYQMLAGRPPFEAANTPAMLMKHISEQPIPLTRLRGDLPANLAAAIERALAKGAGDRWATAADLRDALRIEAPAHDQQAQRRKAPQEITPPSAIPTPRASAVHEQVPPAPLPPARPAPPPVLDWQAPGVRVTVARGGPDARLEDEYAAAAPQGAVPQHRGARARGRQREGRPIDEQIAGFQRHLVGSGMGMFVCWVVNLATDPSFLWAIFPTLGMSMGVVGHGANIWSRGISLKRLFSRAHADADQALPAGRGPGALPPAATLDDQAERLVGAEVLAGPYGARVRRAVEDRASIVGIIERLSKEERALIPEVKPTVDALLERTGALATTLHRLGEDVDAGALSVLDARISTLSGGTDTPERERTRGLLERQRSSVKDLLDRRERLQGQLESAVLVLQNLRLDLLKLRSAGLASSSLDEVASATQEARALSRDIGHAADAAAQVRAL